MPTAPAGVTPSEIVTTLPCTGAFRAPPSAFPAAKSRRPVVTATPAESRQLLTCLRRALRTTSGGALLVVGVVELVNAPISRSATRKRTTATTTKTSPAATLGSQSSGRSRTLRSEGSASAGAAGVSAAGRSSFVPSLDTGGNHGRSGGGTLDG